MTSTHQSGHLSYLVLDGIRLGRPRSADEQAHLAACPDCAGHLQADVDAAALPVPAWVSRARVHQEAAGTALLRRRRPWVWLLALAPAAAAASLWLVMARPAPQASDTHPAPAVAPGEGTREKGTPAVRVFVKRDGRVFVWDGKQAVRAGDRLRLEVQRAGYRFVSVAGLPRSEQPPQLLYQGPLDAAGALLPLSFRVDDRGHEEVLSVILGSAPVPERLHALAGPPDGEAETWRQILMLEKRESSDRGGTP
jgi:hypothetical protein